MHETDRTVWAIPTIFAVSDLFTIRARTKPRRPREEFNLHLPPKAPVERICVDGIELRADADMPVYAALLDEAMQSPAVGKGMIKAREVSSRLLTTGQADSITRVMDSFTRLAQTKITVTEHDGSEWSANMIEEPVMTRDKLAQREPEATWLSYSINPTIVRLMSEPGDRVEFDKYDWLDMSGGNRRMHLLIEVEGGRGAIPIDVLRSILGSTQKPGLPFRRAMKRRVVELLDHGIVEHATVGLDTFEFSQ